MATNYNYEADQTKQEEQKLTQTEQPAETPDNQAQKKPKPSSWKRWLILILGVLIIAAGCITAYVLLTSKLSDDSAQLSTDPIFASEDFPRMDGSTATQPLMLAFYKNFTGHTDAKISDFSWNKTHEAYVNLISGDVDLIVVTQPSEDELALANKTGVVLDVTPVVHEAFVFYVSVDNPVDDLTTEQIQGIYSGKITNWKEVGGQNKPIRAYQRQRNSGSQTGMLELVMKGIPLMEPESENILVGSMAAIVGLVSGYNNANDAIGYSYYYYVTTMYDNIDKNIADGIKLLSIDGIAPNVQNIKAEIYPFKTSYYIVTRDDADSETLRLKEAMLSPRGQNVALEAKYVPIR